MKGIVYCLLAIMLVAGLVLGCAPSPAPSPAPAPAPQERAIELLGGFPGWNLTPSVAFADILTKYLPGVKCSATETGDTSLNIEYTSERDDPNSVLFNNTSTDYIEALYALPNWEVKHTEQRWIAGWAAGCVGLITNDPSIETLADVAGKTIAIFPGPLIGTNGLMVESLKELGIYEQVNIKGLGFDEMHNAFRDKLVDVIFLLPGAIPGQPFMLAPQTEEAILALNGEVYGVDWNHDVLKKVFPKVGASRPLWVAPMGTLPKQKREFEVTGLIASGLCCREDADEQLIYDITEMNYRFIYKFREYWFPLFVMSPDNMIKMLPVESEAEVHPGALRFYKEIGLWDPFFDQRYMQKHKDF